jgi:hypothetical protein
MEHAPTLRLERVRAGQHIHDLEGLDFGDAARG